MASSEISDRLDRLERSNRNLKTALSGCLCCAVAVMVMGASATPTTPKVIDAEKVILRDAAGNERGQLFASENSWGLVLFNKNGSKAAALVVSPALNAILLSDQNGNVRQTVTSDLNESHWSVFHPGSDTSQFEVVDNAQGTALSFHDKANNPQVELGVSTKGSALIMSDSQGAIRASMTGQGIGFALFANDGKFQWAPGLDNFSPEEREKIKALVPKLPK